jgi:hypothetical protein
MKYYIVIFFRFWYTDKTTFVGFKTAFIIHISYSRTKCAHCERDSSGTTEAGKAREGDGADSPTRAKRSGSPKSFSFFLKFFGFFAFILGLFWRFGNFFEKKSPKNEILTKFIELF